MSQEVQAQPAPSPAPASQTLATESRTSRTPHAKVAARAKGLLTLALAVLISVVIIFLTTQYQDQIQSLGNAGYIGLFIVSILGNATIIIPAPAFVVACAAGIVYGPLQVGLIAGLGAALGELTGYVVGYGGAQVLPNGKLYRQLEMFMRKHGMLTIFLLAAIPNPLFDAGGMLAGILRMPAWRFVVAAWFGKAIRLGVTAYACMGGIPFLQNLLHL